MDWNLVEGVFLKLKQGSKCLFDSFGEFAHKVHFYKNPDYRGSDCLDDIAVFS